jgi:hypothetical protein
LDHPIGVEGVNSWSMEPFLGVWLAEELSGFGVDSSLVHVEEWDIDP